MGRGQTSIEFLVLLGFMLLVFTTFFVFAEDLLTRNNELLVERTVIALANDVYEEFSTANQVRDGYARSFELPRQLEEVDYSVQVMNKRELKVNTSLFEYLIFLPFNVTVEAEEDGFLVTGGENVITKMDGVINVN